MSLSKITSIGIPNQMFTLSEANALLPLLQRITKKSEESVAQLIRDQSWYAKSGANDSKIIELQNQITQELVVWGKKIIKLGCKPMGSNVVLFDNGIGHYSWFYGEQTVGYFHAYEEALHQRKPVMAIE